MKRSTLVYLVAMLLLAPAAVQAQSGCVDSPENPTVVFGLLAAIASVAITRFRKPADSRRDRSSTQ